MPLWRAALAVLALLEAAAPAGGTRPGGVLVPRHRHQERRLDRLEREVAFLRALTAELVCTGGEGETLASGAWCRRDKRDAQGNRVPLHFLDAGVAPSVFDLLAGGSVLDVGAGSGQYGRYLISRDASYAGPATAGSLDARPPRKYEGVDGTLNVEALTDGFVRWADLTLPYALDDGPADWVLSLEVGEHIPAQFESVFLDTLNRNNRCGVLLSWAVPGQRG